MRVNENSESELNLIPQGLYTYSFGSAFLANSTILNKQSFNI